MNKQLFDRLLSLADREPCLFLATADADGIPHVAVVQGLLDATDAMVTVTHWFCPQTISNLSVNRHVSLIVWDGENDEGYQLIGVSETIVDSGMLDGFLPLEAQTPLPQVLRSLTIRAEKIIKFTADKHSDIEPQDAA